MSKKVNGQAYYYLRQMARVDGKPKMAWERYLGKAEDIEAAVTGSVSVPERTRHLCFGDLAATWSVIKRLGIAEIVDEVVGPRRADASATVGTYVALLVLNRVVAPCSKLAFSDWWATTAGDRLVQLPREALDHRRFWDAMDQISPTQLAEIERRVVADMVESFDLDCSGLVLDMTNFATYIDSANDKAPIAKRGHAKQKRSDLRLVGLGLVISVDGGVPLVSHAYAGDRPDVTQFPLMVDELASRFGSLGGSQHELTLVYDAGQDSTANQTKVDGSPLHFVGSLPPSDHLELMAVSRRRYRVVDEEAFPELSAFETKMTALGGKYRVVVTHSQNLHDLQRQGFSQTLAKASGQLAEVSARLERGKTKKDRRAVEAEITRILAPRWLERVVTFELTGDSPATYRLSFGIDARAQKALETELFGKRVHRRGRCRLPLPVGGRGGLPTDEGPEGGRLLTHVPLDRTEDPRARPILRARSRRRTADGPRGQERRHDHERPGAPLQPRADPGDRDDLPVHRRSTPGKAHAHRDGPSPGTPLRAVRP